MKVIIAGSRSITDLQYLESCVKASGLSITTVISGTAKGVDTLGEDFAAKYGIRVLRFPANWKRFGRGAGFIRNEDMSLEADAALILWDGRSPGTKHMIKTAHKANLLIKTFVQGVEVDA